MLLVAMLLVQGDAAPEARNGHNEPATSNQQQQLARALHAPLRLGGKQNMDEMNPTFLEGVRELEMGGPGTGDADGTDGRDTDGTDNGDADGTDGDEDTDGTDGEGDTDGTDNGDSDGTDNA
jgi:hypothetical protein